VYYSSFDPVLLAEVRKIDPHAVLGFIFDARTVGNKRDWIETIIDIGHQLQATILSPDDVLLNGNHIQMMHEAGFHVIPWTVNDWQRCLELIEQGVDGIITDYPQDVIEQLRHPAIDY
jgi:glycerophosphoryl diester phosphodiesterase